MDIILGIGSILVGLYFASIGLMMKTINIESTLFYKTLPVVNGLAFIIFGTDILGVTQVIVR